jgi:hypothetical protein
MIGIGNSMTADVTGVWPSINELWEDAQRERARKAADRAAHNRAGISIDWLKGGNFAIYLFFPFSPEASVMPKSRYLCCASAGTTNSDSKAAIQGFILYPPFSLIDDL